jgi:hypothetical protein
VVVAKASEIPTVSRYNFDGHRQRDKMGSQARCAVCRPFFKLFPISIEVFRTIFMQISHRLAALKNKMLPGFKKAFWAVSLSRSSPLINQRKAWVSSSTFIPCSP